MKLTRSTNHAVFAGICGGLAEHLGWSPFRLRMAWVLATIFTVSGGHGGHAEIVALAVAGCFAAMAGVFSMLRVRTAPAARH